MVTNFAQWSKKHEEANKIASELITKSMDNIFSNTSSSNDEEFEKMNNDLDSLLED